MKTIYIGSIYPPGLMDYYRSLNSRIDFAGHTFQTALLKGLNTEYPDITVVTAPPISTFPSVNKLFFKGKSYPRTEFSPNGVILLRCINFPVLKYIFRMFDLLIILSRISLNNTRVILYAIDSPTLIAVRLAKKSNTQVCLIVPDLPFYMRGTKSLIYRISKGIESLILNWAYKAVDKFVLLSKHMKEKLPIGDKPWMLMEGIYIDEGNNAPVERSKKIVFLYTGNLGFRTGVMNLIQAFKRLEGSQYELWIRGNGAAESAVIDMQNNDTRIKYIPPLPKEELIALQKKASFLVNPVPPSQEFTRYFFPSKTMEYLASGTPTIMYKLDCLPEEYLEHVFLFEGESVDSIYKSLKYYSSLDPFMLKQEGEKASVFIKEKKNAFVQAQRIKKFLGL